MKCVFQRPFLPQLSRLAQRFGTSPVRQAWHLKKKNSKVVGVACKVFKLLVFRFAAARSLDTNSTFQWFQFKESPAWEKEKVSKGTPPLSARTLLRDVSLFLFSLLARLRKGHKRADPSETNSRQGLARQERSHLNAFIDVTS